MTSESDFHPQYPPSIGAIVQPDDSCRFRVWAPKAKSVELLLTAPQERAVPMEREPRGYFSTVLSRIDVSATRYLFRLDGTDAWPDPASRFQPEDVHRPSAPVPTEFAWHDQNWHGRPLADYIIYELHIGTFSEAGTFDLAIPHLDELARLGVTAVEIMPVAQFPGDRNWGYDGTYPFAVQNSYGGPDGLRRFVDACHQRGLCVILDVVYNHLGPEGNYLARFGRYFTRRHSTPWGEAVNFDGRGSDHVRRYFIENALYWIRDCHIDALRLDAVHAIFDQSARPFLQELADAVRLQGELLNRQVHTIAESNLNDPRMVLPREVGGLGMDGQWVDDLHHALHVELTNEQTGYYEDFSGFDDLVECLCDGFVYSGRYSHFREHSHGQSARSLPADSFIVCSQNHDQVGNRMLGERLTTLVDFESLKLAAGFVLLSPFVPLLFMGEEYGETAPFQFFISHADKGLIRAVRRGRQAEFKDFAWQGKPPDPQARKTFSRCRLDHSLRTRGHHAVLLSFYRELIRLRRSQPALRNLDRTQMNVSAHATSRLLVTHRRSAQEDIVTVFHFGKEPAHTQTPIPPGDWTVLLNSADACWNGPLNRSAVGDAVSREDELALAPRSLLVLRQNGSDHLNWQMAGRPPEADAPRTEVQ
ncbi:malto-oligosyltrehalose trehalohydrolase [bacterium]|nr:malto-oligosyltrehalose trehalohydrolase [bacterium]